MISMRTHVMHCYHGILLSKLFLEKDFNDSPKLREKTASLRSSLVAYEALATPRLSNHLDFHRGLLQSAGLLHDLLVEVDGRFEVTA
jgi:hypothetical protein